MSGPLETDPPGERCAECGYCGDPAGMIPALDGVQSRCADHEGCHDRKEARSAFTTAA